MSKHFGPWIPLHSNGCPCPGQHIHIVRANGREEIGIAGSQCAAAGINTSSPESAWVNDGKSDHIVKYRAVKRRPDDVAVVSRRKSPSDARQSW